VIYLGQGFSDFYAWYPDEAKAMFGTPWKISYTNEGLWYPWKASVVPQGYRYLSLRTADVEDVVEIIDLNVFHRHVLYNI
jgi:hypothetical protein